MQLHGVRVYRTATQSLVNNVHTIIAFTAEDYDTDGYHDNSSNNHRLTVPTGLGGYYHIFGAVQVAGNATGQHLAVVCINEPDPLDGSTVILVPVGQPKPSGTADTHLAFDSVRHLDEGDYIDLRVYQSSGGPLDLGIGSNPGFYVPSFGMHLVGS